VRRIWRFPLTRHQYAQTRDEIETSCIMKHLKKEGTIYSNSFCHHISGAFIIDALCTITPGALHTENVHTVIKFAEVARKYAEEIEILRACFRVLIAKALAGDAWKETTGSEAPAPTPVDSQVAAAAAPAGAVKVEVDQDKEPKKRKPKAEASAAAGAGGGGAAERQEEREDGASAPAAKREKKS
jgi:hypothetical protein